LNQVTSSNSDTDLRNSIANRTNNKTHRLSLSFTDSIPLKKTNSMSSFTDVQTSSNSSSNIANSNNSSGRDTPTNQTPSNRQSNKFFNIVTHAFRRGSGSGKLSNTVNTGGKK
jgi:hypothetical protein